MYPGSFFTTEAMRMFDKASSVAAGLNHSTVGTEHLLLAIASQLDCIGRRMLGCAGTTTAGLREAVNNYAPVGRTALTAPSLFDQGLDELPSRALTVAESIGDREVNTAHLVLAIIDDATTGAIVLRECGLGQAALQKALRETRRAETWLSELAREISALLPMREIPSPSTLRFVSVQDELERIIGFIKPLQPAADMPVTTSDVFTAACLREPWRWERLLQAHGRTADHLQEMKHDPEIGQIAVGIVKSARSYVAFSGNTESTLLVSDAVAEALWFTLALAERYSLKVISPNLLASLCLGVSGSQARNFFYPCSPAFLDLASAACLASNGTAFADVNSVLSLRPSMLVRKNSYQHATMSFSAELSLTTADEDFSATVAHALSHFDDEPQNEFYARPQGGLAKLSALAARLHLWLERHEGTGQLEETLNLAGYGAAAALLGGDYARVTRLLLKSAETLARYPRVEEAESCLVMATGLARAAGDDLTAEIAERFSSLVKANFGPYGQRISADVTLPYTNEEARDLISKSIRLHTFAELVEMVVARPWLLSTDLDDIYAPLLSSDRHGRFADLPRSSPPRAEIIREFRKIARVDGIAKSAEAMRDQGVNRDTILSEGFRRSAIEDLRRWEEKGQKSEREEFDRAIVGLLSAASFGDDSSRGTHYALAGHFLTRKTVTTKEAKTKARAEAALLEAARRLPGNSELLANVVSNLIKLHTTWYIETGGKEEIASSIGHSAKAVARAMPYGNAITTLLGMIAAACLINKDVGMGPAGHLVSVGRFTCSALGLSAPEELIDAENSVESAELARSNLSTSQWRELLAELNTKRSATGTRDTSRLDERIRRVEVTIGLRSEDIEEVERALNAARHLDDDGAEDGKLMRAQLLLHRRSVDRSEDEMPLGEALDFAAVTWRGWIGSTTLRTAMRAAMVWLEAAELAGLEHVIQMEREVLANLYTIYRSAPSDDDRMEIARAIGQLSARWAQSYADQGEWARAVLTTEGSRGLLLASWLTNADSHPEDTGSSPRDDPLPYGIKLLTGLVDKSVRQPFRASDLAAVERELTAAVAAAAADAPLVYLSPGRGRADGRALIAGHGKQPNVITLPGASAEAIAELATDLMSSEHRVRSARPVEEMLDQVGAWLWTHVVQPLIDGGYATASAMRLVTLDAFMLLPVQVAWTPDARFADQRRYIHDQWTISLTPSANILSRCLEHRTPLELDTIVAIAPEGGQLGDLPFASLEVDEVSSSFVEAIVLKEQDALVHHVEAAAGHPHSVFHFAGHSISDPFHRHQFLFLQEAMGLAPGDLRRYAAGSRRLAVASACATGQSDMDHPDEAISIATGLLAAGYAGAIGMSWRVPDFATAALMGRFYQLLSIAAPAQDIAGILAEAQRWLRLSTKEDIERALPWTRFRMRSGNYARGERPFNHPYYWAAAVYYGA
jgi:hypothetical protein